jgi:hypothetical protein
MTVLNKFKTLLNKPHPKPRFIYAVTAGAYLGELLVYVETTTSNYSFLSIPTMSVRVIPINKFEIGLKDGIVEVVEKLPASVYKVCTLQYKKNKPSFSAKVA